jgi:hypothetical protein
MELTLPSIQVHVLGDEALYGNGALPMPVSMRIMGYPDPTKARTVGLAFVGVENRLHDVGHYVLLDGILHRLNVPEDYALRGALEWSMVETWGTPIVPRMEENDDGTSYTWAFVNIPAAYVVQVYGPAQRARPRPIVRQNLSQNGLWTLEEDLWPVPGGGWRLRVSGDAGVAEGALRVERELVAG